MKMKKLARVFTSAALVSAMVMTMGGMTAFAGVTEMELTKTVTTDGQTFAPNTSFEFTIEEAEAKTLEGSEYGAAAGQELVVYAGIQGALDFGDGFTGGKLVFAPATGEDKKSPDPESFAKSGKLTIRAGVFTQPGIYHYTVKEKVEVDNSYEGIVYDKAVRHVYLYVNYGVDEKGELTDKLEVGNVVVSKEVGDGEVKVGGYEINSGLNNKGIEFTNNYGDDGDDKPNPDPDDPKPEDKNDSTHDVTIGKIVTGNQGDKNAIFNFTVTVNGAAGEMYKVVDKDDNVIKPLTSGTSETYQLKHGETIKITGLTENDTYTVVETEANQNGYTTTSEAVKGTETKEIDGENVQVVTEDGAKYTVTNARNVTTPTGIVLSFAPYILLVALAGVFGVLFLRRKKEEF